MLLLWILIGVLVISGVVFFGTAAAWASPRLAPYRIRPEQSHKVIGAKLWKRVVGNLLMSGSLVFALTYAAAPWLIDPHGEFDGTNFLVAAGVLLTYDLFYYALHRFAFHQNGWLKKVHAVHHVVRAPTAIESLYLHPVETFAGQLLLTIVGCAFGPLSAWTWGIVLLVHSNLNIIVHAGLAIPKFGLRMLSALASKHATHHVSMQRGNYASLTPLWDRLFGTAE